MGTSEEFSKFSKMFKILVLLVGAFIASHARPYLPQHLEHRVHKRDVTKVGKERFVGDDVDSIMTLHAQVHPHHAHGDGANVKDSGDEKNNEPEAEPVKQVEAKPDIHDEGKKDGHDKDGHDTLIKTNEKIKKSGDEKNTKPEADEVKHDKTKADGHDDKVKDRHEKDGHDHVAA